MTELEESHQFTAEDEEEKAERAKEFLSTLNRKRPSRKRYNVGARVSTGQCTTIVTCLAAACC